MVCIVAVAVFNARLAQVTAGRVREAASAYLDESFRRGNLDTALAQARAAREDTNLRLAKLFKQQQYLQQTALQDWDARLAKRRGPEYTQVGETKKPSTDVTPSGETSKP